MGISPRLLHCFAAVDQVAFALLALCFRFVRSEIFMLDCLYVFDVVFMEGDVKSDQSEVQLDIRGPRAGCGEGFDAGNTAP